jgi:phosphoribosyl-ATP pyrophosphohydrolase/phosphoribosyl-AMP cyclohydrolase
MTGFMNQEACKETMKSGKVTFYSRTKKRLWMKGETSGNILTVKKTFIDCDNDTLLILAEPAGVVCHEGTQSCFGSESPVFDSFDFLSQLESLLNDRKRTLPEGSYTSKMFQKGLDKITQKVGEEAVETVIASKNDDRKEFVYESADLIFHLLLLLVEKDVPLRDIINELEQRHS